MQYYNERHRHTCGMDLHGRNLYLCVLDPDLEIVLHRRVDCDEEKLLRALAPYREHLVNQRSSLINHIQVTNLQYNLPELGRISNPDNREGIIDRTDLSSINWVAANHKPDHATT